MGNLCGQSDSTTDRLIRLNEVLERIPVSRSTWWAGVKSGRFPAPVRNLGPRIAAWRLSIIMKIAKGEGWQ
ncbi:AlpA family phage regulatory protein [Geobacter pelophilus]|uniref:AlpA family phage regulatory protein n=2 Tax=Geoanaerobacter pelophilus TaxID=60036 RepID=A0AAW4L913_9BACT|nr:AlpA family phage regulatory protein [Geoanaerobacter pelophilus]